MKETALTRYAIVRSGGKQYRVEEGRTIDVALLHTPEGERVELKDVLLLADDGSVTVGTPTVPDARVVAQVVSHGKLPKITVFRYKAKVRYRRKTGHRQDFTRLAIERIQVGDEKAVAAEPKRPARRRAKATATEPKPAAPRRTKAVRAEAKAEPEPTTATRRRRAAPKAEASAPKDAAAAPARRSRRKTKTESGE